MPAFGICTNFVRNSAKHPSYLADVLFLFTQTNSLRILVDTDGFVLNQYKEIAKKSRDLHTWMRLISHATDKSIEPVYINFGDEDDVRKKFIKLTSVMASDNNLIVWTPNDYCDVNVNSVNLIDRSSATTTLRAVLQEEFEKMGPKDSEASTTPLQVIHGDITYNVATAQVVGTGVNVRDSGLVQTNQSVVLDRETLDALKNELVALQKAMVETAESAEHHDAILSIGQARVELSGGNQGRMLEYLRNAGKWTFDVATKIGAAVAARLIGNLLGIG